MQFGEYNITNKEENNTINLLNGDCIEMMRQLPDNSIDMCLTDPPYGTTSCKWDTVIPFEPMWEELHRIVKDSGAICLFGQNPFTANLIMSNPKMFRDEYCWIKEQATNMGNLKFMAGNIKELISVFSVAKPSRMRYFPQMIKRDRPIKIQSTFPNEDRDKHNKWKMEKISRNSTETYPTNALYFCRDRKKGQRFHPTQKPVALLEHLIRTYTLDGETVLDFTMGSGSTGVACVNLNRSFIGIEKDDKYFGIAQKRIEGGINND